MNAASNTELAALLREANWSRAALARHVVAAATERGLRVGTNRTSVTRMLAGSQPRWPVPWLVATALTHRLNRPVSVTECGFLDDPPPAQAPYDGLRICPTLETTADTITDLTGHDMRRRNFLLGATWTVSAFAESALFCLASPPSATSTPRTTSGSRIGRADVEVLQRTVNHLRQMDQQYGAGRVRDQIVRFLHQHAPLVRTASYTAAVGTQLCSALAQATALAGWTAADIGRPALTQRYLIQAKELAQQGGDHLYAANMLAHMSRQTVLHGENHPGQEHTALHGHRAVALARAARASANGHATPGMLALLHATEARAHALLCDHGQAHAALIAAEHAFNRVRAAEEPDWLVYTTRAEFATDTARVLRATGHPRHAYTVFSSTLDEYPEWQTRRRSMVQLDLALTGLARGDLEQAAHAGLIAAQDHGVLDSAKGRARLGLLRHHLATNQYRSHSAHALHERLTTVLA